MSDNLVYEAAARLFNDLSTSEAQRAAEKGQFSLKLWQAAEEAGFFDVLAEGGDWTSIGDAIAVLTAAGAAAMPLPLSGAMLARRILVGAKHGHGTDTGIVLAMTPRTLAGTTGVRWFWPHDTVGVIACWPAGWALVKSGGSTAGRNLSGEPWWLIEEDVGKLQEFPAACGYEQCQKFMALGRAALMSGAMVEVLGLTIEHANTRKQFGKPLGKQPAVQHQLALMAEYVAASSVAVDFAVRAWVKEPAGEASWRAVATAKIRTGEAAGKVAEMAHQIHGAIGFTREYRLQDLTRRLWTWRDEAGTEAEWSLELGRRLIAAGPGELWPALTD